MPNDSVKSLTAYRDADFLCLIIISAGTMKLGKLIALTTAVMLMKLHICVAQCKPLKGANGCSGVADLKFTDDCNKHDICYACGNGRGVSRLSCDERFYNNMINTCNTKVNLFLQRGCKAMARTYYRGVRALGKKSYNVPSLGFCREAWVPACV
ncbi:uncharacterized protein LOC127835058 [Dreissena polymorpha]|uniref:Uncharacterized protein n=1 Tax=Dreissena polymorpha TaxID=45954 RepID=A0A9D4G7T2_DREPO|nr:uncharacterized protein LOC127835058 [Dreissena polymorpha]KAH3812101.1 hypothetical protein DPMN_140524 [Dreissena polymorpha]